jgi:heat-inducible transcriptional repressor
MFNHFITADGKTILKEVDGNDHEEVIAQDREIKVVYSMPVNRVTISIEEEFSNNDYFSYAIEVTGSIKEIERVVNILDEILHDCLVSEIEQKLNEELNNEEIMDFMTYREDLVNAIVSAFQEMATDKYHISGQSNILQQPEFQDIEKVKDLFDAIEKKEILKVVKLDDNGISVRIGQENEIKALQDCTVITVPYEANNGHKGAISIFGPTRMQYSKIIPLLEYIAKNIKNIM